MLDKMKNIDIFADRQQGIARMPPGAKRHENHRPVGSAGE
jgi:hypothetical protein